MSESTSEVPGVGEPPRYVRFLKHLVEEGGYGLDESHALAGVKEWREAEVVGALLRNVKERVPDAVVGRIFTAVNQDGLVVLVGEAGEPEEGGREVEESGGRGYARAGRDDARPADDEWDADPVST